MFRTTRPFVISVCLLLVSLSSPAARVVRVKTSLSFEPNRGQAPAGVKYLLREGQAETVFGERGFTLALPLGKHGAQFIRFEFSGEAGAPVLTPEGMLAGRTNYLLGRDPAQWVRSLPNYAQLRYAGVYPGIDVLFHSTEQRLEHDFEVAPGADPARIALGIRGARLLSLTHAGDLTIALAKGTIQLKRPNAYQEIAGSRRTVRARFVLARDGTVRFRVGAWDRTRNLTIDPVLIFSTYVDALPSFPFAVATDTAGNTYVAGQAYSFPTTPGALQSSSCSNCTQTSTFVQKLNPTGSEEIFGTMLGATESVGANSIAVDANGNTIVGGGGFILSLTPDGSALNYATANPNLGVAAVTADSSGNAYFTGRADPSQYPATGGALNAANADIFVSKLTPSGTMVYTAYLGNAENFRPVGPSGVMAIAVDSTGSAYITGSAGSRWPTSSGSYLAAVPAAGYGVFVTKLHPDASKLDYSTFVGVGNATAIAVTSSGNAWIVGAADTATYPVTANAYDSTGLANTGFLSELGSDGTQLLYSSYFPTSPMNAVAIDLWGNVWLAGEAVDSWFPLMDPLMSWGQAGFVTEFDGTGTKLEFSTLFGGGIQGIAMDPQGKAHIAGLTGWWVYTTPGSFAQVPQNDPGYDLAGFGFAATIDASVAAPAICTNIPGFGMSPYYPVDAGGLPSPLQLTNCGNAPLTFQSLTTSEPAYSIASSNCTGTLAVGDSCSVTLNFSPAGGPSCNATLTIVSNASIPTFVPLTLGEFTGCNAAGAAANLSPGTLSFPSEAVGATSAPQSVTLSNPGYLPLQINQIAFTAGDFSEKDTCGGTVKPLGSCAISVSFSPLADGLRTATLAVYDSAGDSPEVVQLSGTGTGPAPAVSLSVKALLFPVPTNNGSSAPQTVTVTNSGQGSLSISSIAVSSSNGIQNYFSQTNNCPGVMAAGASCAISVADAQGQFDVGTLTINDNAGNSPQTVTLLGGGATGVILSASPASLTLASAGGVATSTITLTPLNSAAAGDYSLGCSLIWEGTSTGTPLTPACNITPPAVTVASSGGTATMSISTAMFGAKISPAAPFRRSAPIVAAFVCFILIPRRRWRGAVLMILLLTLAVGGISACGGGSPTSSGSSGGGGGGSSSGATPGQYVVQIYSVSEGESPVAIGASVNLTVQ